MRIIKKYDISFYIISYGISDDNKSKLTKLVYSYQRQIQIIEVENISVYFDFSFDTTGWNPVVLLRLLLDKLIPDDVNKLIYLDGDTIVRGCLDDLWNNDKVETLINIMQTHKMSVLSASFTFIDANDKYLEVKQMRGFSNNNMIPKIRSPNSLTHVNIDDLLFHNPSQECAILINRQIANEFVNIGDDTLPHDWEINILGNKSYGIYFYNAPLFQYRIHSNNTIGINLGVAKDKVNEQIRIKAEEDALGAVNFTLKVGLKGIIEQKKLKNFLEVNIENIKNKKFFLLLKQQLTYRNYYNQLKPFLGRMADLVYTLK